MGTTVAQLSPSNFAKQLSDGNALGTVMGQGPNDPIGFFQSPGANVQGGIIQPAGQGANKGIAGTVSVVAVTVTATSVAPNTTAEQPFAVTGAAVGQVVAVQKPTTDAGIAIVGARASASGSVAITYANDTAATVTPTATQTYTFELIPSALTTSATLSPQAIPPNAFVEQQFAVPGIGSGVLIVNKPTAQAGLGIVDQRIVSPGVVGITFGNFTAATITPTAAESYLFFASPELQIASVMRTIAATLTPGSVAANTTAEQTFTVVGLPAGSQVLVNKPSATTGLGIGGARVSAANTLAINFINNTANPIVPPSEIYTIAVFPAAAPAAGSSTSYASMGGGGMADHQALVNLGLVAGP